MTAGMDCGENRHAKIIMEELGITYFHAVPQSMLDSWWFFDCENVPSELPKYISDMSNSNPMSYVGWGLSHQKASEILDRIKSEWICSPPRPNIPKLKIISIGNVKHGFVTNGWMFDGNKVNGPIGVYHN